MVALRGVVAAATAVASLIACAAWDPAVAGGPESPSFLLFSGTDLWGYGASLYGGLLWSPDGLDTGGFTLKVLLDTGKYNYASGGLQQKIDATMLSAAALPGWRFARGSLTVSVFSGPVAQDYRLSPADPGSRLHGRYLGDESAADIWYQPNPRTMAALNAAITTIGPTGYLRAAIGFRMLLPAFIGPEAEEIWCANYRQLEFGAHITALRIDAIEWSMGGGLALTSDQRFGPYLRLGVNARY